METINPRPNPYVGPRAFRTGEKLYGRDRELRQLLDLLVAERIVLLHSPSGAGKTSLLRAGLIPGLVGQGFDVLPVIRVSQPLPAQIPPQTTPNRYMYSTLLSLEELVSDEDTPGSQTALSTNELLNLSLAEYLDRRDESKQRADANPHYAYREGLLEDDVLIFDQFEEILTADPYDQAGKITFFEQVGAALRSRQRWAIFAVREDYMAALTPYQRLIPARFHCTFRLDLLGSTAARQAIQLPSDDAGVVFQNQAVAQIVDDLRKVQVQEADGSLETRLGPYVEPVQLQVVCYRLWRKLSADDDRISPEDVEQIGDVNESLAEYYAERVANLAEETGIKERIIREWVDSELITEQGIRSQVPMGRETTNGLANSVIEALIQAHLVRREKRSGVIWFELSHDRLIEPVRRNNMIWLQDNLSQLQKQTGIWVRQGKPESLLLRNRELAQAKTWAADYKDELLPTEVEFLEASDRLHRRERREKWLSRIIAALGVVAIILAVVAFQAMRNAQRQAELALSGNLAALSQATLDTSPPLSMLLAVEAIHTTDNLGEDPLPVAEEGLRATLKETHGRLLPGQEAYVQSAVFSPDGHWLASGGGDGIVRVWDWTRPETDPVLLEGHTEAINTLVFSPDGEWLASGSRDDRVGLWPMDSDGPAAEAAIFLSGHEDDIQALAFSPDGHWLASGSLDFQVHLLDITADNPGTGGTAAATLDHEGAVLALAFSPDGHWLATGAMDGVAYLWKMEQEDLELDPLLLSGHDRRIETLAFSPDGRWLATGSVDADVLLWDIEELNGQAAGEYPTQEEIEAILPAVLAGHIDGVQTLAFSPGGRWLASGSRDYTAQLWDMETIASKSSEQIFPFVLWGHTDYINSLVFDPQETWLATGSNDGTVHVWNLLTTDPGANPWVLRGHENLVYTVAVSPDGRWLVSGSEDATLRAWDIYGEDPVANPAVLRGHEDWALTLAYSVDGSQLVSGGIDGSLRRWNLSELDSKIPESGGEILLVVEDGSVLKTAYSPDGNWLAAADSNGSVYLWDLNAEGTEPARLEKHSEWINVLVFSPDGRWLATGSTDATVGLWDLTASDPAGASINLAGFTDTNAEVDTLDFSPDGHWLAAGSRDRLIRLWDLSLPDLETAVPQLLEGHQDFISTLVFSPDGRWLASGSWDGEIHIWDITAQDPGLKSLTLKGHFYRVNALDFSPDGNWLASGGEDIDILLWDTQNFDTGAQELDQFFLLPGHREGVTVLVFSADGRQLASGSWDNTIRLWDIPAYLNTGKANPVVLDGHRDDLTALEYSPDGRWLASSSRDGNVLLWLMPVEDLMNRACQSAGRNMTELEWFQFFASEDYRVTCPQWPAPENGDQE